MSALNAVPHNCDTNLVALVCLLFAGGGLLWSSLMTGIQTTRILIRAARSRGCCEKSKTFKRRKRIVQTSDALQFVEYWLAWIGVSSNKTSSNGIHEEYDDDAEDDHYVEHHKRKDKQKDFLIPPPSKQKAWHWTKLFFLRHCIPYRVMSRIWGVCTRVPLPFYGLKWLVYKGWTVTFGCNLEEMRFPLENYPSLSHFFLRPLKDGVRRVDMTPQTIISPVDGKVLHAASGPLAEYDDVVLEQVKGVQYTLRDFIGDIPEAFRRKNIENRKLNTIVLYLSPADYHHFHAPCEATFSERKHFPGDLLPVKPSFAHQVDGLYCVNERVVLNGTWAQGFMSYVAVGALNVGSIELQHEPEFRSNLSHKSKGCFQRTYEPKISTLRGERLGAFHLGSTVVLVFESDKNFEFGVSTGDVVRVGERLDIPISSSVKEMETALPVMCPPWPGQ